MRRSACALLVGAWGILATTASAAGPAWLEPTALSGGPASPASAALAAPGDAAAVWTRSGNVEARVRAPGAGYAPAAPLGSSAGTADVDVAGDGTALAAWAQGASVAYALRAPGGSFGTVQQLTPEGGSGDVGSVRVVMDSAGNALIAYTRGRAYAAVRPAGGEAGKAEALSAGTACDLDAAAGLDGQAAIVWRDCGTGPTPIQAARRTATRFEPLTVASGTTPAVAVDADGTVVVAWEATGATVRAGWAQPGAGFGNERKLADASATPALAATTDGVWAAWRTTGGRVVAVQRPAGKDFGAPAEISPEGVTSPPALAGGGEGSVVAAWLRRDGDSYRVESARRAPGAPAFGPSGLVSAANLETTDLELDADADGNVLASYVRGGTPTVQTLDAAGPRFVAVEARDAGHALDPYPFAVDAADAWSSVASTTIDFGDGTTAPGPRAEHAFATQGEKTITFSATDALGNVSRTTRKFLAAPPLDRTAPVITRARLDAKRFRRSNRETAVVAQAVRRRGTRFRYTLSEPAQVNIFFERVLMGRKRGKVCVRGKRRGRKCRVYQPAGLITRTHASAGDVSVGFSGRIVGRNGPLRVIDVVLAPGRYRATLVAADANRNVSKPVQLAFTLLR